MSKFTENLIRIGIILLVGIIVYLTVDFSNERKAKHAEEAKAITTPQPEQTGFPGFDPEDLNKTEKQKAADAVAAAIIASGDVKVTPNPIIEDMTPPTFYEDMEGSERDVIDSVYDSIWLDAEKRTGVSYRNIKIEDIYRIDDQQFHPAGMNSYEAYVMVNKKCEIVSFSINFQNQNQFRITDSRPC